MAEAMTQDETEGKLTKKTTKKTTRQTSKPSGAIPAMVAAWSEIKAVQFDAENPHFSSRFASLAQIVKTIKPVLVKYDLWVSQPCVPSETGVAVKTVLYHSSGESLDLGTVVMPVDKSKPQAVGSAMTYARRYSLCSALGVVGSDDDDDANHAQSTTSVRSVPKGSADEDAAAASAKFAIHRWSGIPTASEDGKPNQDFFDACIAVAKKAGVKKLSKDTTPEEWDELTAWVEAHKELDFLEAVGNG